jgi:hypothetical protein
MCEPLKNAGKNKKKIFWNNKMALRISGKEINEVL